MDKSKFYLVKEPLDTKPASQLQLDICNHMFNRKENKLEASLLFDFKTDFFIFTHVPKTAGTTTHNFLEKALTTNYIHCRPPNSDWEGMISKAVGAGGHQENYLNSVANINLEKNHKKLLITRDPLERFVSFYKHIQDHPNHHISRRKGVLDMNIDQFADYCIENDLYEFSNLTAKYIVGGKKCPDRLFSRNIVSILHNEYHFIMPIFAMDLLYRLLAFYFGRENDIVPPKRSNVSSKRGIDPDLIEVCKGKVYSANLLDLEIYTYSLKVFAELQSLIFNSLEN